ncbi:MAG: succinate--CoA ligase subunit alpha [Candidatus Nealsonbacteria bacterium]|nr:succinate--CoA ligase subunit alpha [Candidatus Nealsonbacteria bacterium]
MSILINQETRVVVQGITGAQGSFHAKLCRDYGTNISAGVVPGKGNTDFEGIPVYNTVAEAVKEQRVNTSIIFVPAKFAAGAIVEAIEAKLELVVCITEGIPVHDMMKIKSCLRGSKTKLIGPNCPGIISPKEKIKIGIMPANIFRPGKIGIISRSGTLTYEIAARLSKKGFGQSTCVGIGGDPIVGMDFIDCLELFDKDKETKAVVMVGEIGGSAEEETAKWISTRLTHPVVAYICGLSAPPEKRMGHAGAIISDGKGTAKEKIEALESAGIPVAKTIDEVDKKLKQVLKRGY